VSRLFRDNAFRETARIIRDVQKTEHQWFAQGDPHSPTLPWMPFQPAEFLSILFECVPELAGQAFLDVGCGPGTKMLLASHFFGLEVNGIEIDLVMGAAARKCGPVWTADALQMAPGLYAAYDLIWLYRPFRDPVLEDKLEERIRNEMKVGAVLAGGQWETCPAELGWHPVVDDWELRRGAWMKPRPVTDLTL
jgi:SAM-dependent methyltransferase